MNIVVLVRVLVEALLLEEEMEEEVGIMPLALILRIIPRLNRLRALLLQRMTMW
jgi:hypothetical protein